MSQKLVTWLENFYVISKPAFDAYKSCIHTNSLCNVRTRTYYIHCVAYSKYVYVQPLNLYRSRSAAASVVIQMHILNSHVHLTHMYIHVHVG